MARSRESEALAAALKREERGEVWYKNAAAATENPIAKVTFVTLARRQKKCMEAIRKVQQAHRRKVAFPSFPSVSSTIAALLRKARAISNMDTKTSSRDIFKTYLWALGFEEKGAAMHARRVREFDGSLVGDLFDFLRRRKGEHYQILDGALTYLHCPDSFFKETAGSPFHGKGE